MRKRGNEFQNRYLRKILNIESVYYSRVSNAEVLTESNEIPLSFQIFPIFQALGVNFVGSPETCSKNLKYWIIGKLNDFFFKE